MNAQINPNVSSANDTDLLRSPLPDPLTSLQPSAHFAPTPAGTRFDDAAIVASIGLAMNQASAQAQLRRTRMLRSAMGLKIADALQDPDVVEIMLNPDGSLWVDRISSGRQVLDVGLSAAQAERIIRLVAAMTGEVIDPERPMLSAALPETGERFEAVLPPTSAAPTFALRKRVSEVIALERYVEDGLMSQAQADCLKDAVRQRLNILIAGGTSTGKTTLANALLLEIALLGDRVIVLEDTVELQCPSPDRVELCARPGVVSMADLVRTTLRLRPDRVIVGEVRGGEALDLLKVWGTGHPGGIATIHAGSAMGALLRLEQLTLEVAAVPPRELIAEAINVVVYLAGRGRNRRVEQICRVASLDAGGYRLTDAVEPCWSTGDLPGQPCLAFSFDPDSDPTPDADVESAISSFMGSAMSPVMSSVMAAALDSELESALALALESAIELDPGLDAELDATHGLEASTHAGPPGHRLPEPDPDPDPGDPVPHLEALHEALQDDVQFLC